MMAFWTSFAKTGKPSAPNFPFWKTLYPNILTQ
jgi:hypothetical protein